MLKAPGGEGERREDAHVSLRSVNPGFFLT